MMGGCEGEDPVEFMIVGGNYTLEQLSNVSATNLNSDPNNPILVAVMCTAGGPINYLAFQPESSDVTTTGQVCTGACGLYHAQRNLDSSFTVAGYWAYPINSSEAADVLTPINRSATSCEYSNCGYQYPEIGPLAQHAFIPGWYTLVVDDEWGDYYLLHFEVNQ